MKNYCVATETANRVPSVTHRVRMRVAIIALVAILMIAYAVAPSAIAHRFVARNPDYKLKPLSLSCLLRGRRDLYQFEVIDGKAGWVADFSAIFRGVIFEECSFWRFDVPGRFD